MLVFMWKLTIRWSLSEKLWVAKKCNECVETVLFSLLIVNLFVDPFLEMTLMTTSKCEPLDPSVTNDVRVNVITDDDDVRVNVITEVIQFYKNDEEIKNLREFSESKIGQSNFSTVFVLLNLD